MCPIEDMKRKRGFMSQETFETVVKKGIDYGILCFRFCGLGEPLLHKRFFYFLAFIKDHTNCAVELITNGSLLRKQTVRQLIEHNIDTISFSFPSLSKKPYEKIMQGLMFEEVLEKVLYAVTELKKVLDVQIIITSIITKFNSNEIAYLRKFWIEKGVDTVVFHFPHNRGGHLKNIDTIFPTYLVNQFTIGRGMELCRWPLRQFYVSWDGSVFLCCCDIEGECAVGTIDKDDFTVMEEVQDVVNVMKPNLCTQCTYSTMEHIH